MSREHPIEDENPFAAIKPYWGFLRADNLPVVPLYGIKKRRHIVVYPERTQLTEFEMNLPEAGVQNREAPVFEAIAQAEYGGLRKRQRQLCPGEDGDSLTSTPDLLDIGRHIAKEVKGIRQGNSLNLVDVQIAKYLILMAGRYFNEDLSFDFEVFRHGVPNLTEVFKGEGLEGLIKELSGNVRYQLSLPFSIIYHLHYSQCAYTGRHDAQGGGNWSGKAYTRFQSTGLDAMVADPEETIKQIGLNNRSYSVERKRFPSNKRMLGEKQIHQLPPFPIVVVREVNPQRWPATLKGINFDRYLRVIHNQTDINLKNLRLPDYVQIPKDILDEIEYNEEIAKIKEKEARDKEIRDHGFLEKDLLSDLSGEEDGDTSFDPAELDKLPQNESSQDDE